MCGRYALGIRASFVRYQLQEHDMPVADAPDDDEVRQSYNFAPGYHGLVYRADVPDYGAGARPTNEEGSQKVTEVVSNPTSIEDPKEIRYKLQAMKWGLVPFWTKRNPDYGSLMRTINARDDSLAAKGGMWNTMKQRKRCIVIAQGFYEWLKKNEGKEKIPHYVKRKDEQLMCFAGLWDCVQYEGSDEKQYTYTIITTDSNKRLSFLHDRMPVILENGSEDIRTWLDPGRSEWSKELQSLLRPFEGELDCYPVSKDVGKVGNNSSTFIIPVASSENKNNIANFFSNAKKSAKGKEEKKEIKHEETDIGEKGNVIEHNPGETRPTVERSGSEDNAPLPAPDVGSVKPSIKREHNSSGDIVEPDPKSIKIEQQTSPTKLLRNATPKKNTRSATSNETSTKSSPTKRTKDAGSQKITNFYK